MSGENAYVLLAVEAESYVEHLQKYKLVDVGSPSWGRQHEMIEKLNMQAVLNASAQEDEYIKDFLISYNKTECLIYDLIVTEVWKQKIFKELVEMEFEPKTTFPIYMVLYHEATVINLLETTLFFRETCESAEDSVPDLIDYCYRKLTELVARSAETEDDDEDEEINKEVTSSTFTATNMEDLVKQEKTLNFEICIKAVSVLRYITDNLSSLPLSAVTRILNTHDIPILLVQLVESPPWTKTKDGKIYKFIDTKWQEVSRCRQFENNKD
ncbi:hypothetical protein KUTeg_020533 [Tegillarca granosa]|uniref:Uncharacterized protein n=1 Tax=Tegillarca granosa TaxID=220873 RepID=A0ABQ9EAW8_TEGGR|nr:hypothetical protein KUTeg_020533 [Tegillarca granosa]